MIKYIAGIIKAVGDKPIRLITLSIIGIFGLVGIYVYFKGSSSSCNELISQNQRLMKSQSDLLDANTKLVQKNSEVISDMISLKTIIDDAQKNNVATVSTHKIGTSVTTQEPSTETTVSSPKVSQSPIENDSCVVSTHHPTVVREIISRKVISKPKTDTLQTIVTKKNVPLVKASVKLDSLINKYRH
jgi:hypothetical protein